MNLSLRVGFVSLTMLLAQPGLRAQYDPAPPPVGPQQTYGGPASPGGQPGDAAEAEDVPGRGVARISLINGDVSVRRGDSGDIVAAAINAPLLAPDRLLTGTESRAELQFDGSNRLRIAADSELRLAEVEYRRYTIELARGTITWHVANASASDIDISTPSVSIRPVKPGDYRITVNADGTTEVTARTGEAEIYSPRGVERVRRGKTTLVRGDRTDPEFQTVAEVREDEWDYFNVARDRELDRSPSRQYLPEDVVGAEELDANGQWIDSAPYGRVWQPRVAAGWSPYSQGRWAWTDYYGWSWVSYDPFGWAPFHYGTWFHQPSGWCWYPGPRHGRTWWRPAMVAWFGFGNVGVSVGFGNWGWVPLAPFERFRPWYGRGFYGNNRVNIYNNIRVVNNYNIINNYRNARVDGGARGIAAGQFGKTGGRYDRVGEANLRSAGLMQGQLPAAPGRESLSFNDRRVGNTGSRGIYEGNFYNRRPVVAQDRIPFAEQQRGVEQGARAFTGDAGVRGGRGSGFANGGAGGFDPGLRGNNTIAADQGPRGGGVRGEGGNAGGWRRLNERAPGAAQPADGGMRGSGGENSGGVRGDAAGGRSTAEGNGWRRFGEPRQPDTARQLDGGVRGGGSGRELDNSVRGGGAPSSQSGNGWRRFGEPSSDSGLTRGYRESEGVRGGGREYGRGPADPSAGTPDAVRGGAYRQRMDAAPAPESFRGGGRPDGGSRSDSIRVSPPVLRDRSERGNGGTRGGGMPDTGAGMRGGGPSEYRSAPRYGGSAPSMGGGSFGGMRGGGGDRGAGTGGGMRGGGGSMQGGGNMGGSRGGDGGGHRGGGGRR